MLALRLHLEACTVENVVAVCGAEVGEVQLTVAKDTMLDLSVKTMELSWRSSNAQGFLPGKELYVLANGEIKSPGLLDFKKCHADENPSHSVGGIRFDDKLPFVEEPIEITRSIEVNG
ncbi:hypothetical protein Tco_0720533 [Tanacetum coccineum]